MRWPPASFKNCKSTEGDPLNVLKFAMAERNSFKRKCRMYSRRHKRPQMGANVCRMLMNMAHNCEPASRTFLVFIARQSRLQTSSKTVTCGHVKLNHPTVLTGVDHVRARLLSPLPFVPFGSFVHVSHLMRVTATMSVMQIGPCTNPRTMSTPFLTSRLGVSVLPRLLEHFNHTLQKSYQNPRINAFKACTRGV